MKRLFYLLVILNSSMLVSMDKSPLEQWQEAVNNRKEFTSPGHILNKFVDERKSDVIEEALKNETSFTASDKVSALIRAAESAQPEIVELLLAKGAQPNRIGNEYKTALGCTISVLNDKQHLFLKDGEYDKIKKYEEVIEKLLEGGAMPNIKLEDPYNIHPFMPTTIEIAQRGQLPNVLALFKKHGYDLDTPPIKYSDLKLVK